MYEKSISSVLPAFVAGSTSRARQLKKTERKVRLPIEEESDTKKLRQKSEELNRAYKTIYEK